MIEVNELHGTTSKNRQKLYTDIGKRLLSKRKELDLTQEEVAELLKMSAAYYGKIERGEKGPSLEKLILINQVMKIDLNYLLTGTNENDKFTENILNKCSEKKLHDFEQLIKYAKNLLLEE